MYISLLIASYGSLYDIMSMPTKLFLASFIHALAILKNEQLTGVMLAV